MALLPMSVWLLNNVNIFWWGVYSCLQKLVSATLIYPANLMVTDCIGSINTWADGGHGVFAGVCAMSHFLGAWAVFGAFLGYASFYLSRVLLGRFSWVLHLMVMLLEVGVLGGVWVNNVDIDVPWYIILPMLFGCVSGWCWVGLNNTNSEIWKMGEVRCSLLIFFTWVIEMFGLNVFMNMLLANHVWEVCGYVGYFFMVYNWLTFLLVWQHDVYLERGFSRGGRLIFDLLFVSLASLYVFAVLFALFKPFETFYCLLIETFSEPVNSPGSGFKTDLNSRILRGVYLLFWVFVFLFHFWMLYRIVGLTVVLYVLEWIDKEDEMYEDL